MPQPSITPAQLKTLHAILHKKGLLNRKIEIIEGVTGGRSSSSRDLTLEEARDLITTLNGYRDAPELQDKQPMLNKLFAMAHEIGWVKTLTIINKDNKLVRKNDYSHVKDWVLKHGYLKKPLNQYSYKELPKLVSVFEFQIYKPYITNIRKQP